MHYCNIYLLYICSICCIFEVTDWQTKLPLPYCLSEIVFMYCFRNWLPFYCLCISIIPPSFLYLVADWCFYLREKKCIKSQEYAAEHGLPMLENVLLPKTKGFICCLQELRSSLDAGEHSLPPFLVLRTCMLAMCVAMILISTTIFFGNFPLLFFLTIRIFMNR